MSIYEDDKFGDFKKSSWCWIGRCVVVAHKEGVVSVADSKNPEQAPLQFDMQEWDAFIKGVKAGEFDY